MPGIGYTFGKLAPGSGWICGSAGELLGLAKVIAAPKITLDKRKRNLTG